MGLDLIDGRRDLRRTKKLIDPVTRKVANPDSTDFTRANESLQCGPCIGNGDVSETDSFCDRVDGRESVV